MRRFARLVSNWIERLSWLGATLAGVILVVVVFLVIYGVLLRYVFRTPGAWSIELPSFMFLAITALALAYVHRLRGHIGVELLVMRLPQRIQRVLSIVGSIALLIYAGFIAWAGWLKAWDHLQHGERSVAIGVPLFAVQIILPIALLLLCLQALVEISKEVTELRAKRAMTDNQETTVSERS